MSAFIGKIVTGSSAFVMVALACVVTISQPQTAHAQYGRPVPSDGLARRGWPHSLGATNGAGRPSLFFPGYGYAYVLPAKRQGRGLTAYDPYGPPEGHRRPPVYYRSPHDAIYYSPVPLDEPPLWWRAYPVPQASGQPGQPSQLPPPDGMPSR